jgi:predicted nucleic acid-binding protein
VIFVDTSFFFAIIEPRDSRHDLADAISRNLPKKRLATTNLVRGETWTLLNRKSSHHHACAFFDFLDRSETCSVHRIDETHEYESLRWLRGHDEREYSFVDATSFAFMRANRITEALAFDGDFTAAGFVELRP